MAFGISGGALLAAGAAVGGAAISAGATGRASDKAAAGTAAANQLSSEQFAQTRADNQPLLDLRNGLIPRIKTLAEGGPGVSNADILNDPGYQFGMQQGQRAIQGTAAAKGGLYSGATLKALSRFGTDYATTKTNDVFNRKQTDYGNQFNRTLGAAGLGQTAVGQTQQAGQNYTNTVGNNMLDLANFQSAAGLAQSNAWGNALNRVSSYSNAFGGG